MTTASTRTLWRTTAEFVSVTARAVRRCTSRSIKKRASVSEKNQGYQTSWGQKKKLGIVKLYKKGSNPKQTMGTVL